MTQSPRKVGERQVSCTNTIYGRLQHCRDEMYVPQCSQRMCPTHYIQIVECHVQYTRYRRVCHIYAVYEYILSHLRIYSTEERRVCHIQYYIIQIGECYIYTVYYRICMMHVSVL